MAFRSYLWTDDGPWRLPMAFVATDRTHAYPQYAGQRVKTVQVDYEWRGDQLFTHYSGSYIDFDDKGF